MKDLIHLNLYSVSPYDHFMQFEVEDHQTYYANVRELLWGRSSSVYYVEVGDN